MIINEHLASNNTLPSHTTNKSIQLANTFLSPMLFPTRTAARIIFSFFFSLLHLSFHPQAKVVHPIDRIGRSSRGSSSILADILSLQFSNSQEFDAQTVLERSEFRERHPSNSLQPGRSIARRTTKARHGLHHRRCVGHSIDPVSSRSPKKEFSWKSAPRGIATGGQEPTFRPRISQYHHRPRFCALSPAHGREIWKFLRIYYYRRYYCYA